MPSQHITKPNLFGYWLIQSYLPSYWLVLCQLFRYTGIPIHGYPGSFFVGTQIFYPTTYMEYKKNI